VATGGNRFLTIGAAAGSLALLAAAVLILWPPDPTDYSFSSGRDQTDGETVGWVSKVESNTIHVNSGPFGGGVVPLVVTKSTRIRVGAKEGWFEDIRPGGQVKVEYELYHGRRLARTVELLVEESARRPGRAVVQPRGSSAPIATERELSRPPAGPSPDARPAPPARTIEPATATPAAALAPRPAPVAAPAPERPTPARATEARPEPAPPAARPQPAEVLPAPRPSSPTPTRNVSAPEPARPVEAPRSPAPRAPDPPRAVEGGDAADGSAAVDWLLKGRR
jgi:hypothetical protein